MPSKKLLTNEEVLTTIEKFLAHQARVLEKVLDYKKQLEVALNKAIAEDRNEVQGNYPEEVEKEGNNA